MLVKYGHYETVHPPPRQPPPTQNIFPPTLTSQNNAPPTTTHPHPPKIMPHSPTLTQNNA